MQLNSLSIIIPTKDRGSIFYNTLSAAYNATNHIDCEIIVINDSKTDNINIDEVFKNRVSVFNNPKCGVASARNYGAKLSKGDWLLFLDDDMVLCKNNIDAYCKYFSVSEKFGVNIDWEYPSYIVEEVEKNAFGRFLIKYGFTSMRGWCNYPDWPINSSIEVASITSQNLFLSRENFNNTGGYDETFPHAGFEDYAFSKRLEEHSFKIFVDTNSIMYHNEKDRLDMNSWLLRKERGGETRKIAVKNGFGEIEIKYSLIKKAVYSSYFILAPSIIFLIKAVSPFKVLDPVSFACYKFLLGAYIYKGYNKSS